MLFPYIQPRHGMRQMHAFVKFIFTKVWCKAPSTEYSVDLFRGMRGLYEIMLRLDQEDKAGKEKGAGAFFYKKVNEIFIEFKSLTPSEIKALRRRFSYNNRIQALCEGQLEPYRYPKKPDNSLDLKINEFFSNLYSCGFFNLAIVRSRIGFDLADHYKAFARLNQMPCCPFCGLQPMDSEYDPSREAYDHYLPSSVYPFNSVNLRNLAPACHKCNSQYKGAADPLVDDAGAKRRAFYPYSSKKNNVEVSVRFLCAGRLPVEPNEMEINIDCSGRAEEVATWNSIYKIKDRFGAKCCFPPVTRTWMNRVLIECRNYGRSPEEALQAELLACSESPWVEASFLKAAYLREAHRVGLTLGPLSN